MGLKRSLLTVGISVLLAGGLPAVSSAAPIPVQTTDSVISLGRTVITAGTIERCSPQFENCTRASIYARKFDRSGRLVRSFGRNGTTKIAVGSRATQMGGLSVDARGRIYLSANQSGGPAGPADGLLLARLTKTGSLDPTFGTGGLVKTPTFVGGGTGNGVNVSADGQVYVSVAESGSGPGVARFNSSGTIDGSFGSGGVASLTPTDTLHRTSASTVLADGSGVFVGGAMGVQGAQTSLFSARFGSTGVADNAYGSSGVALAATLAFNVNVSGQLVAAVRSARGLMLIGTQQAGERPCPNTTVAAVDSAGQVDPSFGTDGVARVRSSGCLPASDAAISSDGSLYVAAGAQQGLEAGRRSDVVVQRFSDHGNPDKRFDRSLETPRVGSSTTATSIAASRHSLYVAGYARSRRCSGPGGGYCQVSVLTRLSTSGKVDATFGTHGVVTVPKLDRKKKN